MPSMKNAAVIFLILPFILLPDANALPTVETVVADYCLKHSCIETAINTVSSFFKGAEMGVSPQQTTAYNCKNSDTLNVTIKSPVLSTDSEISVNGKPVCEIKGSLMPHEETCFFSINGGNGGDEGYDNVIVNVVMESKAGLLSEQKEYSKNFIVRVQHLQSNREKTAVSAMKSYEIAAASAVSKISEYESKGYNMSSARAIVSNAKTGADDARNMLVKCEIDRSISTYTDARTEADDALNTAINAKKEQDGTRLGAITGKFLSSASNPIVLVLAAVVALLGYGLHAEKRKNKIKLEL